MSWKTEEHKHCDIVWKDGFRARVYKSSCAIGTRLLWESEPFPTSDEAQAAARARFRDIHRMRR